MTFTATFFRRNPQSRNGGYNTTRTIEAKTIKEATKKAKALETCVYGSMELLEIKQAMDVQQNIRFNGNFEPANGVGTLFAEPKICKSKVKYICRRKNYAIIITNQ